MGVRDVIAVLYLLTYPQGYMHSSRVTVVRWFPVPHRYVVEESPLREPDEADEVLDSFGLLGGATDDVSRVVDGCPVLIAAGFQDGCILILDRTRNKYAE